jgi:hypothetical protein
VQENEESGTDYEPVVGVVSDCIVRSLRNRGAKRVATSVQENEESVTDYERAVEEASESLRERKLPGFGEGIGSFKLQCSEASKPSRERKWHGFEEANGFGRRYKDG